MVGWFYWHENLILHSTCYMRHANSLMFKEGRCHKCYLRKMDNKPVHFSCRMKIVHKNFGNIMGFQKCNAITNQIYGNVNKNLKQSERLNIIFTRSITRELNRVLQYYWVVFQILLYILREYKHFNCVPCFFYYFKGILCRYMNVERLHTSFMCWHFLSHSYSRKFVLWGSE